MRKQKLQEERRSADSQDKLQPTPRPLSQSFPSMVLSKVPGRETEEWAPFPGVGRKETTSQITQASQEQTRPGGGGGSSCRTALWFPDPPRPQCHSGPGPVRTAPLTPPPLGERTQLGRKQKGRAGLPPTEGTRRGPCCYSPYRHVWSARTILWGSQPSNLHVSQGAEPKSMWHHHPPAPHALLVDKPGLLGATGTSRKASQQRHHLDSVTGNE
jgi:hypothetical protein